MLSQVLRYLKNWFVVETYSGHYTVKDGSIALPFLADGQYFRIFNSVFNDGVYQYPCYLVDEEFDGVIMALAIPADVLLLVKDIEEYQKKYGEATPYTSESFGGYSYTKATGANGAVSWREVFRLRLNQWRKL